MTDSKPAVSDKVLARIEKMLAHATDNSAGGEHERDTALKMAYRLLAKHNLTEADLPGNKAKVTRCEQHFTMSADKWARNISGSIADLFFASYFFMRHGAGKDSHHFIGRQTNVVTAAYMSEYLIRSIKKEATKRYKSPTSPEGRSFCVGAVRSIADRVFDMVHADTLAETVRAPNSAPVQAHAEEQSDADALAPVVGSALVLTEYRTEEETSNEAYMLSVGIKVKTEKDRVDNALRGDSFRDGKAFGKNVSLNIQVK